MRYSSYNKFHAFSGKDSFSVIENQKQRIISEIQSQKDNYILNVNRTEYINYLISKYRIAPIKIHNDRLSVSTYEAMIPAEYHPVTYFVRAGKYYKRDIIKYHLPFTGESELLKVRASTYTLSSPLIMIEDGCICFEIINFNLEADQIKQESQGIVQDIINQNEYLTKDLEAFNNTIERLVTQVFDSRKQKLMGKNNLVSSLGVPVRKVHGVSDTFSVPAHRTNVIPSKPKPKVTETGYKPEPAIDESIYQQILKLLNDVGKEFERLPSTYTGKKEENLRDHFLLFLEPNFEGTATGETFNKSGKTDILMRYEGNNVFIAECKFWRGIGAFHETIDQILSYLTWRDSKAAILCFVKNKELNPILEKIESETSNHNCFVKYNGKQSDSWFNFEFHLKDDPSRGIKLAVLCFHFPSQKIEP